VEEGIAVPAYPVPWWAQLLLVVEAALALYYLLCGQIPAWLLVFLIVVLAPMGAIVLLVGAVFLGVLILTLSDMVALRVVGESLYAAPGALPWWFLPAQASMLGLLVLLIAYLIRRR
jgi:hypothetical protein